MTRCHHQTWVRIVPEWTAHYVGAGTELLRNEPSLPYGGDTKTWENTGEVVKYRMDFFGSYWYFRNNGRYLGGITSGCRSLLCKMTMRVDLARNGRKVPCFQGLTGKSRMINANHTAFWLQRHISRSWIERLRNWQPRRRYARIKASSVTVLPGSRSQFKIPSFHFQVRILQQFTTKLL